MWLLLARHGHPATPETINLWSWLLFGAVCVGVLVLGLRAPRPPRLAQLGFLVVAGFLLVNKVYSPQYVLWLLPLAVMARPRWRDLLIWQSGELFYYVAIWMSFGGWLNGVGGRRDAGLRLGDRGPDRGRALPRGRGGARRAPAGARRGAVPQVMTTRSKSVAVKRTRTSISSPTSGTADA